MKEEHNNIDLFDKYSSGALSEKEKLDFENRLKTDSELNKDFGQYKDEMELIRMLGVREEMAGVIDRAHEPNTKARRLKYLIPLGLAASMTLLLLLLPEKAVDSQILFDQHFSTYPNRITSREGTLEFDKAMSLYDQGLHLEAIEQWSTISMETDTAFFYRSISHLALREGRFALEQLDKVGSGSIFSSPKIWYKGLAFLLIDQKDSAKFYMQLISSDSPNKAASDEILKWLNE